MDVSVSIIKYSLSPDKSFMTIYRVNLGPKKWMSQFHFTPCRRV